MNCLERGALGVVVVRVERREVAVDVEDPPEVLERAARVPERVALEVEEEVARRGVGQEREAELGLRLEEDVLVRAVLAREELERGLLADLVERVWGNPGGALGRRAAERSERRDAGDGELVDLRAADARDAREVVDPVPVRLAERPEVADRAVLRPAKARCAAGRRRTPRACGGRAGSKRRTPPAGRTRARRTRARRA